MEGDLRPDDDMSRQRTTNGSPERDVTAVEGPLAGVRSVDVERRIEAYTPRGVDPTLWAETLRPFVLPALRSSKPVGIAAMERFARVLTLISAWCVEQGIPLDIEAVLDPDTVERFCSNGLKKTPSRGSYRATLRKLGRELTTTAPWEPRPEPMPARKVAPPTRATSSRRSSAPPVGSPLRSDAARRSRSSSSEPAPDSTAGGLGRSVASMSSAWMAWWSCASGRRVRARSRS